jgi:hypothetical protein
MATFRVGQRVRVKSAVYPNAVATVTSELHLTDEGELGHRIDVDGIPPPFPVKYWTATPDRLEPLQPERNQTVAWSECAWMPEHLREVA